MTQPLSVLMPLYPNLTQLDFTGPHQFLARAPDVEIVLASLDAQDISVDGLTFSGLADLADVKACNVLLVPGGPGCISAIEDDRYLAHMVRLAATADYITSVCSGSLILGAAGLLRGRRAACHWAWRELLPLFEAIPDDGRVVRDGNILTGGGVTAGIDFALALIAELRGKEIAQTVQLGLEYEPEPPFRAGRPELAPPAVVDAVNSRTSAARYDRRVKLETWVSKRRCSFSNG